MTLCGVFASIIAHVQSECKMRYPPGFLQAARYDGLHRVKSAAHMNDV